MGSKQSVDFILLSPDKQEKIFFSEIAQEFNYSHKVLESLDDVLECQDSPILFIASAKAAVGEAQVTEVMQVSRQQFPDAYLILIVSKQLPKKESEFLQKLGARLILLDSEVGTSKPAFAVNQVLRSDFLALKPSDLLPDTVIPFRIFHLMPQRQKFLPILNAGDRLDAQRLGRLKMNSEYYFAREEALLFKKYVDESADMSAKGLAKRCRANIVALQEEFNHLVFELTDESDRGSFKGGQELLKKCSKLCEDLLLNLAEFPRAWEVVNNSSIGSFGALERSPAIAAYCGLFALQADLEKISELMVMALLVDLGTLAMPLQFTRALRSGGVPDRDLKKQLMSVPQLSLDILLRRKLAVDERTRNILISVYSDANGDKDLRVEAQMIRFAKILDSRTQTRMGQVAANPIATIEAMVMEACNDPSYTDKFVRVLKEQVLPVILELKSSAN